MIEHAIANGKEDIRIAFFPGPINSGWAPESLSGFVKALRDYPSGLDFIEPVWDNPTPIKQRKALEKTLSKYNQIDYIVGNAVAASEAVKLLQTMGQENDITIVSTYFNPAIRTLLEQGKKVVVLVDEAQALADVTLEALRLFSNLETTSQKLLQVVLFAQPELDVRLAESKLRQLRQRITFSYQLRALTEKEIEHYIGQRLKQAGYRGALLFDHKVCCRISHASRGIPRLINILCHKVLLLSYGQQNYKITAKLVDQAVVDTEDAYPVEKLKYWWWGLTSVVLLNLFLLLWWKGLL